MAGTSTSTPLRASTSATRPMRCTFVYRSARPKPRPEERVRRNSSPSSTSTRRPSARRRSATAWAIVVFPELGRPVSHTVAPHSHARVVGLVRNSVSTGVSLSFWKSGSREVGRSGSPEVLGWGGPAQAVAASRSNRSRTGTPGSAAAAASAVRHCRSTSAASSALKKSRA